jgi:hypothetical protein
MLRLSFAEEKRVAGGNGGAQRSTDGFDRVLGKISDGSVKALRFRTLDRPFGLIPTDRTDRTDRLPSGGGVCEEVFHRLATGGYGGQVATGGGWHLCQTRRSVPVSRLT